MSKENNTCAEQDRSMPKHWEIKTLGEVCVFSQGIQVDVTLQSLEKKKDQVRFLRIIDFTQGDDPHRYIDNPGERYFLKKDDIAMVRYGTVGFVCTGKEGAIANNLFKIEPDEKIYKKFLIQFLQSELFRRKLETKGATMQALSFGLIKPIQITIPPLQEQQAIVFKIEELLSDLENGKQQLQIAQQQLKIYRQSLLKRAFEGKLTNKNVKDGELPKGWRVVEMKDVVEINPKIPNRDKISNELEIQFIPMKLVEQIINKIHLLETRKYCDVLKGSYTPFIEGDILFAKVTPCMENGKIAIAENLKNRIGFGSSEFHIARCSKNVLNKFIFYFIVQDKFRSEAAKEMAGAVGLRRVPKQFIENYSVPVPPLSEQQLIVDELESKLTVCDKIEETISQSLLQAESLRQSILKKAFEGKLINYE